MGFGTGFGTGFAKGEAEHGIGKRVVRIPVPPVSLSLDVLGKTTILKRHNLILDVNLAISKDETRIIKGVSSIIKQNDLLINAKLIIQKKEYKQIGIDYEGWTKEISIDEAQELLNVFRNLQKGSSS